MVKQKRTLGSTLADIFEIFFIGISVFFLVYVFVGQLMEVTGKSMFPTFKDKELIIVEKISVKYKNLERGEVVVFKSTDANPTLLIKRVIGLPGETIKVDEGKVFINGTQLSEPYLSQNTITSGKESIEEGAEYKIPENNIPENNEIVNTWTEDMYNLGKIIISKSSKYNTEITSEFVETPCRIWIGYIDNCGYGELHIKTKKKKTHIFACEVKHSNKNPDNLSTIQLCDNKL
jgi:signal peptidase I